VSIDTLEFPGAASSGADVLGYHGGAVERSFPNITTVATDLRALCSNWGANPRVSEAQRKVWPESALPHAAWGADDPGCLRLLEEDGHDGEPVGSLGKDLAVRFFSATEHVAPPERDLVRFGVFCRLGFFRTLHLVVKNRWEDWVLREKGWTEPRPPPYAEALTRFEEGALARLVDGFRLGLAEAATTDAIHALLEEHGRLASGLGFDRRRLSALVDQMVLSRVHYCGAGSAELDSFEARQEHEIALLRSAAREEESEFWMKKSSWLSMQSELEDKLLLREEIRLRNFNVSMEWMSLFGPAYLALLDAQRLCHELETRIAIRSAEPSLGDEEIERRVQESLREELASFEKLKEDARRASSLARLQGTGDEFLSGEKADRYRDEAKKLIREIWRLTHPDALDAAFTDSQRERLRAYLEQVVQIRRSEALLDVRAISVLTDILERVRELYDVMGLDLEPKSVIRGETLADQIAWLEGQIRELEDQAREVMAEIQALSMDPDIREKRASMASEDARQSTLAGLEEIRKAAEERNLLLEAEHRRLLEGGRRPVASR